MNKPMKNKAFTIIELLTVMSIIVILISLLVPSLNRVRRYARTVAQKAQFHDISKGLEMFKIDFDEYPNSDANDTAGKDYCGAMKLCEALLGQDGLGFHIDSRFTSDDTLSGTELYPASQAPPYTDLYINSLRARKLYIDANKIKIGTMEDLYDPSSPFDPCNVAISDVFDRKRGIKSRNRTGMPILYYKANVLKFSHNLTTPDDADNIYNYKDNDELVGLRRAGEKEAHPLFADPNTTFYEDTWNRNIATTYRPYNTDSYILISAGWDGLYGTRDDVHNFKD